MSKVVDGKRYKIISIASSNVMSLSENNLKVQSYWDKNLDTQVWIARWNSKAGNTWAFESLYEQQGKKVYLGVEWLADGASLVGKPTEVIWWIESRGGAEYKLWVDGYDGHLADLSDGSDAQGAKIQVWKSNNTPSQYWLLQRIPDFY